MAAYEFASEGYPYRRRHLTRDGLLLAAALLVLTLAASVYVGLPRQSRSHARASAARGSTHASLLTLPATAQGPVSAAVGRADPRFRVRAAGAVLSAWSPAQRLRSQFSRSSVSVSAGSARLSMRLAAIGYGSALRPVDAVVPRHAGNRVAYAHGGVDEWYLNGPLGLEQGFTLAHAPAGERSAALTLDLAVAGDVRASLLPGGKGVDFVAGRSAKLRYKGLTATDASGHALRSWLSLADGQLLLHVDAAGAQYPVRIDPFVQGGQELTGGGEEGSGKLGYSVAVSRDGNTAIVGAPSDGAGFFHKGAAWVFARSGSTWTQQGSKLTGAGGEPFGFGNSVALSADGNTALIGALYSGGNYNGAAYVFTRSGSAWNQQGAPLIDAENSEETEFGSSVALSSDGSTALIGALNKNESTGAAYVFTRSGEAWSQQSGTLLGSGAFPEGEFGASTALSADGNTALIGGPSEEDRGTVWVFTRTGSTWAQQGPKLNAGSGAFGTSVALSGSGNTALIGAASESAPEYQGAAYVYTRTGSTWTKQEELTLSANAPGDRFGSAVALSAEGNIALIGAQGEDGQTGGAWLFNLIGGKWMQGERLHPEGESGNSEFGYAVGLSEDGGTALVGGLRDNGSVGAAWAFIQGPSASISNGSSSEVSQSGCSFTVEGEHASLSASAVEACLSSEHEATITDEVPSSSIEVKAPINGPPSSTLTLKATGEITQLAKIKAAKLKMTAASGIELPDSENEVEKLEAESTASGDVKFANSKALEVDKLKAAQNAKIASQGDLTTAGEQKAAGNLELNAINGKVKQVSGKMVANTLKTSTTTGVEAEGSENEVGKLEAESTASGDVKFANSKALEVDKLKAAQNAKIASQGDLTTAGEQKAAGNLELNAINGKVKQVSGKMVANTLKTSTTTGVEAEGSENEVGKLEAESTASGDVKFANSKALEVDKLKAAQNAKIASQGDLTTAGEQKAAGNLELNAINGKVKQVSGKMVANTLKTSATTGISVKNAGNEVGTLEASNTASGNIEYVNQGSLNVGTTSTPGKGKVSIALTDAQAKATAIGPIVGKTVGLKADQMQLSGGSVVASGSATLAPSSSKQPVNLGSSPPNTLGLSPADINAVAAKKLTVGGTAAGPITVSAVIAPTGIHSLSLETPGKIAGSGGGSLSVATLSLIDTEAAPAAAWTITPSTVTQDAGTPLPYSGASQLAVTGGHTFDVTASGGAKYSVGGGPSAQGTLTYHDEGRTVSGSLSPPKGVIGSPGVKPVKFSKMTAVNIVN